jgi:hypothetical protein
VWVADESSIASLSYACAIKLCSQAFSSPEASLSWASSIASAASLSSMIGFLGLLSLAFGSWSKLSIISKSSNLLVDLALADVGEDFDKAYGEVGLTGSLTMGLPASSRPDSSSNKIPSDLSSMSAEDV